MVFRLTEIPGSQNRLSSHVFVKKTIPLSEAASSDYQQLTQMAYAVAVHPPANSGAAQATDLSLPLGGQRSSGVLEYFHFQGIKLTYTFHQQMEQS